MYLPYLSFLPAVPTYLPFYPTQAHLPREVDGGGEAALDLVGNVHGRP